MKLVFYLIVLFTCSSFTSLSNTDQSVSQPETVHDQSQRLLDVAMEATRARELQEVRLRLKRGDAAEFPLFSIWDEVWVVPRPAAAVGADLPELAVGATLPVLVVRPVTVLWPDGLCLQASPDSHGGQGIELRLVDKIVVDRITEILLQEGLIPKKRKLVRAITTASDARYYRTFTQEGSVATLGVEFPGSTYKQLHLNGKFLPIELLAMSKDAGVFELLRSSTRGRGVPIEKIGQPTIRGVPVNEASKALWFSRQ